MSAKNVGLAVQPEQSCWEGSLQQAGKIHPLFHWGKLLMSLCLPGQRKPSKGDDAECPAYSFICFCRSKNNYTELLSV